MTTKSDSCKGSAPTNRRAVISNNSMDKWTGLLCHYDLNGEL